MWTVPVTSGGMDMDVLERKLVKHRELAEFRPTPRQPYWSMVYVIPDHQNPTGTCMSPGEGSQQRISPSLISK